MRRHPRRSLGRATIILGLSFLSLGSILVFMVEPIQAVWEIPETASKLQPSNDPSGARDGLMLAPPATEAPVPDEAEVPILMYHYVSELPPDADVYRRDLTVSPEAFEAQLEYLDEADYDPITLTDLHLYLTEGYPLPEKPVILTFDDGYRDAYEVVFPKLLNHGFPGTFFVLATPAHHESEAYLTWSHVREMSDAGMDIQAHSRDHVDLRDRSYEFLVYQVLGIREAIEHHTGRVPRFFCYPSGRWDEDVIKVLQSAGYRGAVTTAWGRTHTSEELFEMARIRINGGDSLPAFIAKLEGEE